MPSMELLRKHWWALVLAFLVGVTTIAPALVFTFSRGYQGITMMGADAESHYLARIRQVYDGFPTQGDTFFADKSLPPIEPGLGEWMVARTGELLRLSASQVELYGKFFLPFLAALLIYALVYALSASRATGVLSVLAIMFGDAFVSNPKSLLGLLHGSAPTARFLTYARPINPGVSALFLFGALYLVYQLFFTEIRETRGRRRFVFLLATGLLAGMSLYVSFYTFAFLTIFGVLLLVYRWIQREYKAVLDLALIGAVAVTCAIPFLLNYERLIQNPAYAAASMRFGLMSTHAPLFSVLLVFLLVIPFFFPKRLSSARLFFVVSAIALSMLINQQILTGREIQSGHFHWYVTKPLFSIMAVLLFTYLLDRFIPHRTVRIVLCALAGVVLIYAGALIQYASYRAAFTEAASAQAYAPVLAWLAKQPGTNTVWADSKLSPYISIYTQDNAPNNPYAVYYLIPEPALIESALLPYRLEGVAPSAIQVQLQKSRAQISQRLFGVYWSEKDGSYADIPVSYLAAYATQYAGLHRESLASVLASLGVTEVVWDTKNNPGWDLNALASGSPVSIGRFRIYRLPSLSHG